MQTETEVPGQGEPSGCPPWHVAVVGDRRLLAPLVLSKLASRKAVTKLTWIGTAAPTVASPKLDWVQTLPSAAQELPRCDTLVLVGPEHLTPEELKALLATATQAGMSHLVAVWLPTQAASAEQQALLESWAQAHEGRGATLVYAGLVVGTGVEGPWGALLGRRALPDAATLSLVWDEDLAEAVAIAALSRPNGTFSACAGEPLPATQLVAESGWHLERALQNFSVPAEACTAPALPGWRPRASEPAQVLKRFAENDPGELDRRLALLFKLLSLLGRGKPKKDVPSAPLRVGLYLTGPGGGSIGLVLDGPSLRVEPGPMGSPHATLKLKASLFRELLAGKTSMATAQLTGRVRIEGDPFAIALVGSICQMLQKYAERRGLVGWLVGRYMAWLQKDADA